MVFFWLEKGIRIFRVDNPHTKPFDFWQWLISEVRERYPDVIFLSEAFTRPKVMYRLAKLGFSQSYTYFTWRNTKAELISILKSFLIAKYPNFSVQTFGLPLLIFSLSICSLVMSGHLLYDWFWQPLCHQIMEFMVPHLNWQLMKHRKAERNF